MKTATLTVIDTDQSERKITVELDPNDHLMHVLRDAQFDVPGACGGIASCGTCHIEILSGDPDVDIDDDEEFMLDTLPNATKASRLSCQIPLTAALDGMKIRVLGDE